MNTGSHHAEIIMRESTRTFTYDGTAVLSFSMRYPEVRLTNNRIAEQRINRRIHVQAVGFYRYAADTLYPQAVQFYKDALQNGFPFRPYEAVLHYEVTYNEACHLSVYRDRYEYTGGAHGNTLRSSDTWDVRTGRNLPLAQFFAPGQDFRMLLIGQILAQADQNMQQNPNIYFPEYRTLIARYFDAESYYLTPEGLVMYYQQYEIAPYATGIVTFTLAYEAVGWQPSCRR